MKKQGMIFFILILLLGFWLRFYQLGQTPAGFHQDEVVNAYVGKFILKNGKDLYGNRWPLFYFDKWGDYPPVLPMYFAGLGAVIFGNNVFGARASIAFFGWLTIIVFYFFSLTILKDKKLALFSTLLLAINPWHIVLSRAAAEGVLALFFYLFGLVLVLNLPQGKKNFPTLAAISFLFAFFTYPSFRLIVPFTFLGLLGRSLFKKSKETKIFLIFFVLFLFFVFFISQSNWGKARFEQTSIFAKIKQEKESYNRFIYNENSVLIARIFNNKLVYLTREFVRQFFLYFSPVFLFIDGGNPSWFSSPNSGLFFVSSLFLLIFLFFEKKKDEGLFLIFYFLLVAVLPAALTAELSPHVHRSLAMIPFFIVLASKGFAVAKEKLGKKFLLIYFIFLFFEFVYFYHNYFQHVSMTTAIPRSDGNQKLAQYLVNNHSKYNKIHLFITGWFPLYYLYFSDNYSPDLIGQIKKGMRTNRLDNIYFYNQDCPKEDEAINRLIDNNDLLIFSSTCALSPKWRIVKVKEIENISKTAVYRIFTKELKNN